MLDLRVLLSSKVIIKLNQKESEERIKELVEEIKEKQHTNPAFFKVSEDFQEYLDYKNHAEISVLFGELMCLVHEFRGVLGMQEILIDIVRYHDEKLVESYKEFEDFRNKYSQEWEDFKNKK